MSKKPGNLQEDHARWLPSTKEYLHAVEYKAELECNNCGNRYSFAITKGITVAIARLYIECPNCGCKTMRASR